MAKEIKEIKDLRTALTFRNHGQDFKSGKKIGSNSPQNIVNRTFKLTDYFWSDDLDFEALYDEEKKDLVVPKMILTEFQPKQVFTFEKAVKNLTGGDWMSKIANLLKGEGGGITGAMTAAAGSYIKKYLDSNIISKYSVPLQFDDGGKVKHPILETPIEMVKRMLAGQYLNVFEIPLFDNKYLKADTTDSWSTGGSDQVIGGELQTVLTEEYNVNFPMAPIWKKQGDNSMDFNFEVYLINKDDETLYKNFQFLHAFVSGCFWIQAGLIQKSPNLYDVEIPGRMHLYFCAMGVEVTYEGRCRTNPYITNKLKVDFKVYGLPDINEMLYPDAYKLNINIKSLIPNNFNLYLDYLFNKEKTDEVYISNKIEKFSISDFIKNEIRNIF